MILHPVEAALVGGLGPAGMIYLVALLIVSFVLGYGIRAAWHHHCGLLSGRFD